MSAQLYIWRDERWHRADSFLPEIVVEEGVESDRAPGFPSLAPDGRPTNGKSGALNFTINEWTWSRLREDVQRLYRPVRHMRTAGRTSYEILPRKALEQESS